MVTGEFKDRERNDKLKRKAHNSTITHEKKKRDKMNVGGRFARA